VDVVRRLWDSSDDRDVIRDVATGRNVEGDKPYYINFIGRTPGPGAVDNPTPFAGPARGRRGRPCPIDLRICLLQCGAGGSCPPPTPTPAPATDAASLTREGLIPPPPE
jgi:hypothetical protein